jgi:hypothetical protein
LSAWHGGEHRLRDRGRADGGHAAGLLPRSGAALDTVRGRPFGGVPVRRNVRSRAALFMFRLFRNCGSDS